MALYVDFKVPWTLLFVDHLDLSQSWIYAISMGVFCLTSQAEALSAFMEIPFIETAGIVLIGTLCHLASLISIVSKCWDVDLLVQFPS